MSNIPHLLVHDHGDNVGVVVVEGLTAGTEMFCCVTHDNSTFTLTAGADVPIGHKIALKDLKDGDTAVKYGEDIGKVIGRQGRTADAIRTIINCAAAKINKRYILQIIDE